MKKLVLAPKHVLALLGLGLASPAVAADLPSRHAAPTLDYYAPPPVFTWTGFYAGLNGDMGLGRASGGGDTAFGNLFGGLGGVTAGYNYQSGSLLVGAEADIAFGSVSGSGSPAFGATSTGRIQGLGTARVRFGYVYDRAIIYLTGGYAGASLHGDLNDTGGTPNLFVSQSQYLSGWTLGAGAEFAVTPHVSVKGEYLFTALGASTLFGGTRDAFGAGATLNLLRAGVNYKF